jgi:fibronectin-binding autotransporter adhesin
LVALRKCASVLRLSIISDFSSAVHRMKYVFSPLSIIAFCATALVLPVTAHAANGVWAGGNSGLWSDITNLNWTTNTPPSAGANVTFNASTTGVAANMNMTNDLLSSIGVITVGSVPGGSNAKPLTIGGNSFSFAVGGNNISLQSGSTDDLTLSLAAGNTITLFNGTQTWVVNQPRTLTVNSPIVGGAGAQLTLSGPGGVSAGVHGTVILNAASPNLASTVVLGGPNMFIRIGDDQAFGTGTVNINSLNSAPQLEPTANRIIGNPETWTSGFGLSAASGGDLTLSGPISLTGTAANRTVNNTSSTKTVYLNGNIVTSVTGEVTIKTLVLQTNPGNIVVNGTISDFAGGPAGPLSKLASGTATINSTNNTYAGQTTITAGVLEVALLADQNLPSSLGTGTSVPGIPIGSGGGAGTLRYIGSTNSSTNRAIQLAGSTGGATLDSSGAGTVSFTSPTMGAPVAGIKTLTFTGTNTGANTFASVITDNSVTNKTTVSKTGTGNWQLIGNNTHSGGTTVDNGGLALGHKNAAGTGTLKIGDTTASPSISISATTDLSSTGAGPVSNAVTVTKDFSVAGSNNLELSGAMNLGAVSRTVTVTNSGSTIFSGVVGDGGSGTGGITKAGNGVLILSGANTYGTIGVTSTTVSAGRLLVNNTTGSGTGPGNVLVNGGTLGGTGSIGGSVSVTSGHLSPGASINHLDIGGNLSMTGGSFDYEINSTTSTADLNTVAGNLSLASVALSASELGSGLLAYGTKFTLINYGGTWNGGIFTGLPNYSTSLVIGANRFYINYSDTTGGSNFGGGSYGFGSGLPHYLTITAVPEASTFLTIGIGGIFAIAAVWMGKRMGLNVLKA